MHAGKHNHSPQTAAQLGGLLRGMDTLPWLSTKVPVATATGAYSADTLLHPVKVSTGMPNVAMLGQHPACRDRVALRNAMATSADVAHQRSGLTTRVRQRSVHQQRGGRRRVMGP